MPVGPPPPSTLASARRKPVAIGNAVVARRARHVFDLREALCCEHANSGFGSVLTKNKQGIEFPNPNFASLARACLG